MQVKLRILSRRLRVCLARVGDRLNGTTDPVRLFTTMSAELTLSIVQLISTNRDTDYVITAALTARILHCVNPNGRKEWEPITLKV